MPEIKIYQCDICKTEQRSDAIIHWSNQIDGPVILSFKECKNNQREHKFSLLCYTCSHAIEKSITDCIDKLMEKVK